MKRTTLVFVDEGHRGLNSGQKWKGLRDVQSPTMGFTFEYSATFDEAIKTTNDVNSLKNIPKAIIMDYSYSYFYGDGFGKEFRIMNLKKTTHTEHGRVDPIG